MTLSTEPFRRMLAALVAAVVTFTLGYTTGGPTPAESHAASDYFVGKWGAPSAIRYSVGNTSTVSRSGIADAASFGRNQWNAVSGSTASVSLSQNDGSVNYEDAGCRSGYNGIWVFGNAIDGAIGVLANVRRCTEYGDKPYLTTVRMQFDTAENWNFGSGTPGERQFDARGVAVHEFGHALGFRGHWSKPSALCADSFAWADHTLCPIVRSGWTNFRTLASHDQHTMANAY